MTNKPKIRSVLEICSRCHEIADLKGKKICYWCELEEQPSHLNGDVYDLPANCRTSIENGDDL